MRLLRPIRHHPSHDNSHTALDLDEPESLDPIHTAKYRTFDDIRGSTCAYDVDSPNRDDRSYSSYATHSFTFVAEHIHLVFIGIEVDLIERL
jgi:hypothetical protein